MLFPFLISSFRLFLLIRWALCFWTIILFFKTRPFLLFMGVFDFSLSARHWHPGVRISVACVLFSVTLFPTIYTVYQWWNIRVHILLDLVSTASSQQNAGYPISQQLLIHLPAADRQTMILLLLPQKDSKPVCINLHYVLTQEVIFYSIQLSWSRLEDLIYKWF